VAREAARRRSTGTKPQRRLKADARRSSILEAARIAFSKTGDVNGTTVKVIAEHGGISEGIIYRHFESKDQLFYEAVVDPLRKAVDNIVAASDLVDGNIPLTPQQQLEELNGLYGQLISTLEETLPLLGLVLFGDPKMAKRFFDEHFVVAMDRLADAWRQLTDRYGLQFEAPDISARAVMGIALMLAIEGHHDKDFDADRATALASKGTMNGFFPLSAATRQRH
jgi:AcrR family transcriptional regulator